MCLRADEGQIKSLQLFRITKINDKCDIVAEYFNFPSLVSYMLVSFISGPLPVFNVTFLLLSVAYNTGLGIMHMHLYSRLSHSSV